MTSPAPHRQERRRGDRRGSDRRDDAAAFRATLTDESLFDAIGEPAPQALPEHEAVGSGLGWRGTSGWGDGTQTADSRFLSRQARRIVSEGGS